LEAFTATLALDPKLLRGLRHSLASWLEGAGALDGDRDSMVLATHEAAAHAMENAESGSTLDVTADRDGTTSFVVHVRCDAAWEAFASDPQYTALNVVTSVMADVSARASHTVRMRTTV
jgi:hypothetical protein